MTDNKLTTMIEERKSKRGGARPGAGRKRRLEEHEIMMKLAPMGVAQYATYDGAPLNTARDPLVGVYPLLNRYMVRFG